MSVKNGQLKKKLITELIHICNPENLNIAGVYTESKYIDITEKIAASIGDWDNLGISYGDYIELSGESIDVNCKNADKLDLNTCIATLICVHRQQHFAYSSDVIMPRIESGMLLRVAKRISELITQT